MNSIPSKVTLGLNFNHEQITLESSSNIVAEFIKFVIYQKLQIPYTYQCLEYLIDQKLRLGSVIKESILSQRHFQKASCALENIDLIIKSLLQEINGTSSPEEVCIIFGATPTTCKEVYRFILPSFDNAECSSKSYARDRNLQYFFFRTFITSEALSKLLLEPLAPTKMYVFIQKKVTNCKVDLDMANYLSSNGCKILRKSKIVIIDLRNKLNEDSICCSNFQRFEDKICESKANIQVKSCECPCKSDGEINEMKSTDSLKWFQSAHVLTGFTDCIIDGSSVTNTWKS